MRRALLALLAVAVLAPAAQAATPTRPVYDSQGRLVQAPFAPVVEPARLTEQRATAIFLAARARSRTGSTGTRGKAA